MPPDELGVPHFPDQPIRPDAQIFVLSDEQAKLAGSPRVYWFTFNTNHTAMQLYDKVAEKTGIVVYRKVF